MIDGDLFNENKGKLIMKIIIHALILSVFLLGSNWANALECEVTYKAKRIVVKKYLIREVKKPEYKAGTVNGKGATKDSCEKNALLPLKKKGWKIKSSKISVTSK